jgi:uncharacterized protein (UPF0210 family)
MNNLKITEQLLKITEQLKKEPLNLIKGGKKMKQKFSSRIDSDLLDELNKICEQNPLYYKSALINQAVKEFLENHKDEFK